LNFYGPAQVVQSISYDRALVDDGGIPPGFFKDKYVFIGARGDLAFNVLQPRDEFRTPWARFRSNRFMPGVEIHATAFLNLLRRDWLERVPLHWERWGVLVFGLALGCLRLLKPWRAVIISLSLATALFVGACLLQWHARYWCNWAVPVLLQIPVAMVLVVASRYYIEERQKRIIVSAMGRYVSPDLVREIADQNFSLAPGGKKVVATMLFSDLANFTTLSEKLGDAARLSEELIKYFTRTTDEVFALQGMVISFIGDSVFASWGNLVPQTDHAERAVRAAWKMNQVSAMEVAIPQLDGSVELVPIHTRIGIHTGEVLAGNLGSEKRVDYTLIGDAVNFASRLEGANKYTKTGILLSEETASRLGGKFLLRRVGAFLVKGKRKAVVIHELLGLEANERPAWLEVFESALNAWTSADFPRAREGFTAVIAARGGTDGPSQFYLDRIDKVEASSTWTGAVSLEDK
jgi:adenylate cyclase